jgi:hypothetical protein
MQTLTVSLEDYTAKKTLKYNRGMKRQPSVNSLTSNEAMLLLQLASAPASMISIVAKGDNRL